MKLFYLCVTCALCLSGFSKANADALVHPFYLSPKGVLTSQTNASYNKQPTKAYGKKSDTYRTRELAQELTYGVSDKVAILGQISNGWKRKTTLTTDQSQTTHTTDENINWAIGGVYDFYRQNNMHLQARLKYLQRETHHMDGAYKGFSALVKAGYDFSFVTPYIGALLELPIAQHKYADNNPKYDVFGALYMQLLPFALDEQLHYSYDKMDCVKNFYLRSQAYFLLTEHIAIGGFLDYSFYKGAKASRKAQDKTFGATLTLQF